MTRKLVGYSTVGTNNKEKAEEFYNAIFSFIDAERFSDPTDDRITFWMRDGGKEFVLAIAVPYNGETASSGNGSMTGISLDSQEEVKQMYAKAIELGAQDEGEPGMRGGTFYGAYVRDLDGNKLVFFHFS